MKQNSIKKQIRLKETTCKQIVDLGKEWGLSETAVIERLVSNAWNNNVTDENIILARLTAIDKRNALLSNKCETFFKLIYFILPNVFARLPPLPKGKDEAGLALDRGSNVMQKLVALFRKDEREHDIRFLQSVYGDTQEALEEGYERS